MGARGVDQVCICAVRTNRHTTSVRQDFGDYVRRTHDANPSSAASPWRVAIYSDDIGVGNLLRTDNRRKCTGWYWMFEELGPEICSRSANWLPLLYLILILRWAGPLSK